MLGTRRSQTISFSMVIFFFMSENISGESRQVVNIYKLPLSLIFWDCQIHPLHSPFNSFLRVHYIGVYLHGLFQFSAVSSHICEPKERQAPSVLPSKSGGKNER